MPIKDPIFIVGVGRSGSSAFHEVLAHHPHIAWFSGLADRFPRRPGLNRLLLHAIDMPVLRGYLKRRVRARECYLFWEEYIRGFTYPCRDLVAGDVTARVKKNMPEVLAQLTTGKRHRLLTKVTGWPRVGFLHEIFPDAKFIHIIRDGRAVVNSMLNVDWWWGWRGPQNWRFGELPKDLMKEWEKHNRSFIALAAIEWKLLMDAADSARDKLAPAAVLEIRYEDLCSQPLEIFREVAAFADLTWTPDFEAAIRAHRFSNSNYKAAQELTPEQMQIMEAVMERPLKRYGY